MIPRIAKILVGVGAVLAMACVDLSAPKGPASISLLQVPVFFVVRGDVMRDTLGNPSKPGIIAYDGAGVPLTGVTPEFFVTDSNPVAHFDANGVLAGDRFGTVHVLGQIGNLQTGSTTIFVTVAPTKLVAALPDETTLAVTAGADSASSIAVRPLQITVRGGAAGDTAVGGVLVRYTMVSPPFASRTSSPAVYLGDDSNNPSVLDTADVSGLVSRRVIVNAKLIADQTIINGRVDSVIVEARAKYKGADLGPPLRFVVRFKVTF